MVRKSKNTDYRQYYKDYFDIEFGNDMDVHHIDFDRNNNDISNLILIPKSLHQSYHMYIKQLGETENGVVNINMWINSDTNRNNAMFELSKILSKSIDWLHTKGTMMSMKRSGVKWSDIVGSKEIKNE